MNYQHKKLNHLVDKLFHLPMNLTNVNLYLIYLKNQINQKYHLGLKYLKRHLILKFLKVLSDLKLLTVLLDSNMMVHLKVLNLYYFVLLYMNYQRNILYH